MTWAFYRAVTEGEPLLIGGLDIWEQEWLEQREPVAVKDPIYQQDHTMNVYHIVDGARTIRFAAGEFSNMVWGIYLPG